MRRKKLSVSLGKAEMDIKEQEGSVKKESRSLSDKFNTCVCTVYIFSTFLKEGIQKQIGNVRHSLAVQGPSPSFQHLQLLHGRPDCAPIEIAVLTTK